MNPVEKVEQMQRRVDAVNQRVMKKQRELMKPTQKQMELSILVSAVGSVVLLLVAGIVSYVYRLHLQAASLMVVAGVMLLNAVILKNKKCKS